MNNAQENHPKYFHRKLFFFTRWCNLRSQWWCLESVFSGVYCAHSWWNGEKLCFLSPLIVFGEWSSVQTFTSSSSSDSLSSSIQWADIKDLMIRSLESFNWRGFTMNFFNNVVRLASQLKAYKTTSKHKRRQRRQTWNESPLPQPLQQVLLQASFKSIQYFNVISHPFTRDDKL